MNKEKIKNFLLENEEVLKDIVYEINSWNGSLDWLDYQENGKDFFETYFYNKPDEAVRAVYYGDYRYMDDYVRFNAYGNLESCNEYGFIDNLKDSIDDIVEALIENKDNITIYNDELKEILESEE